MNKLYKALICGGDVSLSVLDTTELVSEAIKIHSLDGRPAETLGNLLTCAAYMSGCLKSERGAVSITIRGEGASTVSVSGDIDLHIRGYIDGEAEGRIGGGYLTVIKEDGFFRPFTGTCSLVGDDVSQNLMEYFRISEQIDTAVSFGVKLEGGKCIAAGGVVMQMMPAYRQESMDRAEELMQHFVDPASVIERLGADGIMEKYFFDIPAGGLYEYFPQYRCNCSREKIAGVIKPLGRRELLDIVAEQGAVKVHCHYCNTDYTFNTKEVEKLFDEEDTAD